MSSSDTKPQISTPVRTIGRRALPPWVQVVALLIVFGAGYVVGAMVTAKSIHTRLEEYRNNAPIFSEDIVGRLRIRLQLADAQVEEVRQIIERRHMKMIEHRQGSSLLLHEEFDAMADEVAGVLDDQQVGQWYQIADMVRQRFLPPIASDDE